MLLEGCDLVVSVPCIVMLGSTSVSAFGRERQNRAQSVLADLVDAFIPPTLDLGYAERSKIIQ